MSDWKQRLTTQLEPILHLRDPRPKISSYHDMPYAIFRYPPHAEFELRAEVTMLRTRLEQAGKRVTIVSLAECLNRALDGVLPMQELIDAEQRVGLEAAIDTVHEVLSTYRPLYELVVAALPEQTDPYSDLAFITRAGALYPVYRTSSLLEQLKGLVQMPSVLFYPGDLDGAAGLRFMGVLDAEHNYRPKIF
jgi:hypothetical protein